MSKSVPEITRACCRDAKLPFERVWGNGVRIHVNSKGKITPTGKKNSSEEDRTHDAARSRTASPTHYQRAIPAPVSLNYDEHAAGSALMDGLERKPFLSRYPQVRVLFVSLFLFFCCCFFYCLFGLVVKASASRAEDPGFESRLRRDFFRGRVIPVT